MSTKSLCDTVHAIYIRSHYKNILTRLGLEGPIPEDGLICILTGTPGIGKSLFAVYLLYTIMTSRDFPQIGSILYRRNDIHGDVFFAFQRDGSQWIQAPSSLNFQPQLFINDDSRDIYRTLDGATINLLITSPRVSGYKQH